MSSYEWSVVRCSFCGRDKDEVIQLIAGPRAFICDGCVALCAGIIAKGQGPGNVARQKVVLLPVALVAKELDASKDE